MRPLYLLPVASVLAMLLVLPYSALAQDSATAASVEADEEQAKRNRAGDERFECVPPERPEPVLEDLGFDIDISRKMASGCSGTPSSTLLMP